MIAAVFAEIEDPLAGQRRKRFRAHRFGDGDQSYRGGIATSGSAGGGDLGPHLAYIHRDGLHGHAL